MEVGESTYWLFVVLLFVHLVVISGSFLREGYLVYLAMKASSELVVESLIGRSRIWRKVTTWSMLSAVVTVVVLSHLIG